MWKEKKKPPVFPIGKMEFYEQIEFFQFKNISPSGEKWFLKIKNAYFETNFPPKENRKWI